MLLHLLPFGRITKSFVVDKLVANFSMGAKVSSVGEEINTTVISWLVEKLTKRVKFKIILVSDVCFTALFNNQGH